MIIIKFIIFHFKFSLCLYSSLFLDSILLYSNHSSNVLGYLLSNLFYLSSFLLLAKNGLISRKLFLFSIILSEILTLVLFLIYSAIYHALSVKVGCFNYFSTLTFNYSAEKNLPSDNNGPMSGFI